MLFHVYMFHSSSSKNANTIADILKTNIILIFACILKPQKIKLTPNNASAFFCVSLKHSIW